MVALLLQIGSNLANDVFDYERGVDSGPRLGPLRVAQAGLLQPGQIKRVMALVFALAALCGLYLAFVAGWVVIPIGAAAILAAIAYTAGPYPLGYHGLGELFVFLFFGIASVTGTYFVQTRVLSPAAWLLSVPVGLIIVGILIVNNLRDRETDAASGKHTLAVRFGSRFAKTEYLTCLILAFLAIPVYCTLAFLPWSALITWLSLPLAYFTARIVLTRTGSALNEALARTGQLALLFSLLFLISVFF
jgi:1,4-dihydroxy-2-naphthoate octaprenyltransferase